MTLYKPSSKIELLEVNRFETGKQCMLNLYFPLIIINLIVTAKSYLLFDETFELNKTHDAWCSDNSEVSTAIFTGAKPPSMCYPTLLMYNKLQSVVLSEKYVTSANDTTRNYFICE
jgi:hypothetical protein